MAGADYTGMQVPVECQRLEPVDAPPMSRRARVDIGRIMQGLRG